VRFLVKTSGNDVNAVDAFGNTALHVAVERGHVSVASALLEHGANADPCNAQVMHLRNVCFEC
jgi:ankyrin repeat protein